MFKKTLAAFAVAAAFGLAAPAHIQPFAPATATAAEMKVMTSGDLRVALNKLLAEHATLAAAATNAALRGRQVEFGAAADALDMNSQDIAKAVGAAYGEGAGEAFLPLWRKHIGFFVDYTTGKAKGSKKMQEKAVNDLLGYAGDFAAFLSSASPALPKEAVEELVKTHIISLKDVVDAQAAKNPKLAYQKIREAAHHMQMIADPLAATIAAQFPEKFPAM